MKRMAALTAAAQIPIAVTRSMAASGHARGLSAIVRRGAWTTCPASGAIPTFGTPQRASRELRDQGPEAPAPGPLASPPVDLFAVQAMPGNPRAPDHDGPD